jgi:hypothetical protein
MSAEIVKRTEIAKPIFNPKLARDSKLSLIDNIRIYTPVWLLLLAFVCTGIAIAGGVVIDGSIGILFGVLAFAIGIWSIFWCIAIGERNAWNYRERKERVYLDRFRQRRYHNELEKTRLRHLDRDYTRFSVRVKRSQSSSVEIVILKHEPNNRRCHLMIPWVSAESKLGFGSGGWKKYGIESKELHNPNVDEVQSLYDKMQQLAADLEEQSYQEALSKYKTEAIVAAVNIPGTSANDYVKDRLADHKEDA